MSQQINLFNPLFLKQKKYFSALTMVQGLGMIAGVLLLFQVALVFQLRALERQKAETQALHAQAQQQMLQLSSPRGRSKLLEDEMVRTEASLRAQRDVLDILEGGGNFGNGEGYSRFLTALARKRISGLWLTRFAVSGGGDDLSIRGRVLYADLLPQYIRQLNQEPVMRGHIIAELSMTRVEEQQGAQPPQAAPVSSQTPPLRYVEFALSAAKPGGKPESRP